MHCIHHHSVLNLSCRFRWSIKACHVAQPSWAVNILLHMEAAQQRAAILGEKCSAASYLLARLGRMALTQLPHHSCHATEGYPAVLSGSILLGIIIWSWSGLRWAAATLWMTQLHVSFLEATPCADCPALPLPLRHTIMLPCTSALMSCPAGVVATAVMAPQCPRSTWLAAASASSSCASVKRCTVMKTPE